jgi:hypothetical protein
MRRLIAASCAAAALAAFPATARADVFSSLSYGAHVSTIGDGITLEKPLLYDFSLRLNTNALSVSQQFQYDRNPYTTTTHYNDVAVIADYRPHAGRYRISAGLVFGNDYVNNVARDVAATIRVGNGLYPVTGTGTVTARVRFDRPSIYAGVGTGTGLIRGLALQFDGGLLIRNGTATATATGPLNSSPAFQADLRRLSAEQRTHVVVPVMSVGFVYRP